MVSAIEGSPHVHYREDSLYFHDFFMTFEIFVKQGLKYLALVWLRWGEEVTVPPVNVLKFVQNGAG